MSKKVKRLAFQERQSQLAFRYNRACCRFQSPTGFTCVIDEEKGV